MASDEELVELDIDVITITRDADGVLEVDGGELAVEELVFMLRLAETLVLLGQVAGDAEDDDEADE